MQKLWTATNVRPTPMNRTARTPSTRHIRTSNRSNAMKPVQNGFEYQAQVSLVMQIRKNDNLTSGQMQLSETGVALNGDHLNFKVFRLFRITL